MHHFCFQIYVRFTFSRVLLAHTIRIFIKIYLNHNIILGECIS